MKLMRSMPGVPSATPAQENSACTGPPHSSRAASIEAFSERSRWMAFTPGSVISARSMTTTSAPASLASSATAAPMPVAPPTTSARRPSYLYASNSVMSYLLVGSGHHAADLEVQDRVGVEPQPAEDGITVLVELGRPPGRRGLPAVLDGGGGQPEGHALGRLAVLDVAVRHRLRVGRHLQGVLNHRPLAAELQQTLAPVGRVALGERLPHRIGGGDDVLADGIGAGEALVVSQLGPAEHGARLGPVPGRLQAGERHELAVAGAVGAAERVSRGGADRRRGPA